LRDDISAPSLKAGLITPERILGITFCTISHVDYLINISAVRSVIIAMSRIENERSFGYASKTHQKGFTLIELIAILVILGIMFAVAVPNYIHLISAADNAAAIQAVAEGKARLNQQYGIILLNGDSHVHKLDSIVESVSTDAGDYQLIFTVSKNHKEVEVKAVGIRSGVAGQASGKWSILIDES
jgi:prepilin-type N-terminal cleavage/methylation domain-containing protein